MKTLCTLLFAAFMMTACDSDRFDSSEINTAEQPDYTQVESKDGAVYEDPYKEGDIYEDID